MNTGLTITASDTALTLEASDELREALREAFEPQSMATYAAMPDALLYDAIEPYSVNGQWTFICPEDIGALTDAPIIAESACPLESGEMQVFGHIYWFPDYTVRDPWRELADTGRVSFPHAMTIN